MTPDMEGNSLGEESETFISNRKQASRSHVSQLPFCLDVTTHFLQSLSLSCFPSWLIPEGMWEFTS
jgi:hypothetical protein